MPTLPASGVPRIRAVSAVAIVLGLALGTGLAGCAYEYDDGFATATEPTAAPTFTDAALTPDPRLNQPVSGEELDAWAAEALPDTGEQVFHTNYGVLAPGEDHEESTASLPAGSYALTLACRSPRRVSFSIGHGDIELVDLNLRCGTSRVNVVYLPAGVMLQIKVEARRGANFAYRVGRI
ncbi:DUF6023 family protein [Arthrobacter sp. EPSL27]|uniref:DUF6023 family protein n=1 Tax=Arthrobacter sp. EPSL27 TaxID=1745378 RepID=UPI0009E6FCE8|nr:DUF6023 family protein [Arthrobacter sp. EPSL27]